MTENFDDSFYLPVSSAPPPPPSVPESAAVNTNASADSALTENLLVGDESMAITETVEYKPLSYHWFYTDYVLDKLVWLPMSYKDSENLEIEYKQNLYVLF